MKVKAKKSMSTSSAASAAAGRRIIRASSNYNTTMEAVERKEIERWRRQQMKGLCAKLASLIPKHHYPSSKERMTQLDILDAAVAYIKELKERVDEMERNRRPVSPVVPTKGRRSGRRLDIGRGIDDEWRYGVAQSRRGDDGGTGGGVRHQPQDPSSQDVVLITGVEQPFELHDVITVLEEEGAEVFNANLSVVGCKIFCIVHTRAFNSRIGMDVSRVSERLRALV